jgi:hypothetical protein
MKVNTNRNAMFGGLMALTLLGTLAPITATAQDDHDRRDRRERDYNYDRDRRDRDDRDRDRRDRDRDRRDYRDDHDRWNDNWSDRQRDDWLSRHRRETKNEWRNIAIGAGALGALGFLTHDNFLGFAGTAGALYSLNRYDQDRRSENREDRVRAAYFGHPYFYRDGVRYERRLVRRGGDRYYQFVRVDR